MQRRSRRKKDLSMPPQERTKVCLSCETDVNFEATYCPFCGADLSAAAESSPLFSPSSDERFETQPLKESLASLYKPPYSARNRRGLGVPDERVETTFTRAEPAKEDPLSYYEQEKVIGKKVEEGVKIARQEKPIGGVLPLVLLSIGTLFLVLAIVLFFFSKGGVLTLEWKSSYWFLYALLSFPFLFFAIRLLKKL